MKVFVDNLNKEHSRFCTAFGGEQVEINPGAKRVPIDESFTWKMHPDVVLTRNSTRTFKTADEEDKEKQQIEKDRIENEQKQQKEDLNKKAAKDDKNPA